MELFFSKLADCILTIKFFSLFIKYFWENSFFIGFNEITHILKTVTKLLLLLFPHDLVQCPQGAISWLTKQRPFFISRSELFYEINCPKKVGTSLEKCQWWNPIFIRP